MCSWGEEKGKGLVSWKVGKEGVECLRGKKVVRERGGPEIFEKEAKEKTREKREKALEKKS